MWIITVMMAALLAVAVAALRRCCAANTKLRHQVAAARHELSRIRDLDSADRWYGLSYMAPGHYAVKIYYRPVGAGSEPGEIVLKEFRDDDSDFARLMAMELLEKLLEK